MDGVRSLWLGGGDYLDQTACSPRRDRTGLRYSSQERNFLAQRREPKLASFALNARAETAVAKKICRHVFQIAELLRVSLVVQFKSVDGGVRSQIRTRLQRQFPASREINRVI
jgi:hypothetical protein